MVKQVPSRNAQQMKHRKTLNPRLHRFVYATLERSIKQDMGNHKGGGLKRDGRPTSNIQHRMLNEGDKTMESR